MIFPVKRVKEELINEFATYKYLYKYIIKTSL